LERSSGILNANGLPIVDDYELLSRLTFLIWGSGPDRILLDEAEAGTLAASVRDLAPLAERLLGSERAPSGLSAFVEEWLGLYHLDSMHRDPDHFPEWRPDLPTLMKQEVRSLFHRLTFVESTSLLGIFTDTQSQVPEFVLPLYGSASTAPLAGGLVDFAASRERGGVLGMPGFIAAQSSDNEGSLVERGLFVLRSLTCRDVPPPPANVATDLEAVPQDLPQRDRFALHAADPACQGCHSQFDPLGHAFEPYDGLGRHHSVDAYDNPVRGDGVFILDGVEHSFADLRDFQTILSTSETVQRCMTTKYLQYALGRPLDPSDDAIEGAAFDAFRAGGFDYGALVRSTVTHPNFELVARQNEGQAP
jgi:hypothetical protein